MREKSDLGERVPSAQEIVNNEGGLYRDSAWQRVASQTRGKGAEPLQEGGGRPRNTDAVKRQNVKKSCPGAPAEILAISHTCPSLRYKSAFKADWSIWTCREESNSLKSGEMERMASLRSRQWRGTSGASDAADPFGSGSHGARVLLCPLVPSDELNSSLTRCKWADYNHIRQLLSCKNHPRLYTLVDCQKVTTFTFMPLNKCLGYTLGFQLQRSSVLFFWNNCMVSLIKNASFAHIEKKLTAIVSVLLR